MINREELLVAEGQFSWFLNVDILVLEELSLQQLDYIGLAVRAAFQDVRLPQVFVTTNENTGKVEVGLAEEIYEDQDNTDSLKALPSAKQLPFLLSIGFVRHPAGGEDALILDLDDVELQCVDQVVHLAIDSKLRLHAMEQTTSRVYLNPLMLKAANLAQVVKPKVQELDLLVTRMMM